MKRSVTGDKRSCNRAPLITVKTELTIIKLTKLIPLIDLLINIYPGIVIALLSKYLDMIVCYLKPSSDETL